MHTTQANFSNDDIAQAIAGAQVAIEHLTYKGKAARKAAPAEYTVKAVYKRAGKEVQIIDHFIAVDDADAMNQFADIYDMRATHVYRTRIAR